MSGAALSEIRAGWSTRSSEGSCNGCRRLNKLTSKGGEDYPVLVLDVRGLSLRFCEDCFDTLSRVLHAAGGA